MESSEGWLKTIGGYGGEKPFLEISFNKLIFCVLKVGLKTNKGVRKSGLNQSWKKVVLPLGTGFP